MTLSLNFLDLITSSNREYPCRTFLEVVGTQIQIDVWSIIWLGSEIVSESNEMMSQQGNWENRDKTFSGSVSCGEVLVHNIFRSLSLPVNIMKSPRNLESSFTKRCKAPKYPSTSNLVVEIIFYWSSYGRRFTRASNPLVGLLISLRCISNFISPGLVNARWGPQPILKRKL